MPPPSRPQAARSPLGDALLTLPAALLVSGGLCLWASLTAPDTVSTALAWCGGAAAVLLSAAVSTSVYGLRLSRRHLADADAVRAEADAVRAEAELLADETLPALVAQLRGGASADTALGRTAQPATAAHRRIMQTLAVEVGRGERMRAAAMSACANAAGRVQALATGMLADLREMEHRHGEEVLGDLLRLDHSTAQAGRLADSIAVLTGARSGRRWNKPIAMESILRGAMGLISAYRRVQLHNSSTAAVAGHAAEGIMHALAEVMDNAASFSPPTSPVHVYVEEAQAGVVVSVEDSGLVMSETALRRAESAVSADTLDLMSLSGTRLGLAVVGCLARKHGLNVSFRPSARGGTGVVVLIPQQLITEARPAGRPAARDAAQDTVHEPVPAPGPQAVRAPSEPVAPVAPSEPAVPATPPVPVAPPAPAPPTVPPQAARAAAAPEYGESGLPKRRRGQTLATTAPSGTDRAPAARPAPPRPARSREEAAERFRTFRRAVQGTPGDPPAPSPAPAPARPEDDIR
ncbi:sensor histidine kinase [Streptomyces pinistramenti]|uniref:sensor histidine kinase n=1 Tax=Streptomyces pinistramenti TaxID=2884812 RepID=UPI001D06023C|nr:ATP-binding protein [Streptomyces pinistramenti]MCB5908660.1 ATP-binding protein [Streptomyces pinistramenti]